MPITTQSPLCPNCCGAQCLLTQRWWQWCDLPGMQQAISGTVVLLFMYGQTHFSVWTHPKVLPILHRHVAGRSLYNNTLAVSHTSLRAQGLSCWQGGWGTKQAFAVQNCCTKGPQLSISMATSQEILQVRRGVCSTVALPAFLQEWGLKLRDQEEKATLLWLRGPFSFLFIQVSRHCHLSLIIQLNLSCLQGWIEEECTQLGTWKHFFYASSLQGKFIPVSPRAPPNTPVLSWRQKVTSFSVSKPIWGISLLDVVLLVIKKLHETEN